MLTLALSGVRSLRFGRLFPPVVVVRPPRLLFWFEASEEFSLALASVDSETFLVVVSVADGGVVESVEVACADLETVAGLDDLAADTVDPVEVAGVGWVADSSFKGSIDGISLGMDEESSLGPAAIPSFFAVFSFVSDGVVAGFVAGVGP